MLTAMLNVAKIGRSLWKLLLGARVYEWGSY